jgi:hypothetical protein
LTNRQFGSTGLFAARAETKHKFLELIRKTEVWGYQFDAGMSYPLA